MNVCMGDLHCYSIWDVSYWKSVQSLGSFLHEGNISSLSVTECYKRNRPFQGNAETVCLKAQLQREVYLLLKKARVQEYSRN